MVSTKLPSQLQLATHILGILLAKGANLCCPPQVAGEVDSAALIRLLEQLAAVKRALCDKRVVVVAAEVACRVQPTSNDAHSLKLRAAITNSLLIDGKGLCKEFVRNFLVSRLVSYLAAANKKTQRQICGATNACVERRECRMRKLVESTGLGIPVFVEVLPRLELAGELERCGNESRCGVLDALIAVGKGLACDLKKLLTVRCWSNVLGYCHTLN